MNIEPHYISTNYDPGPPNRAVLAIVNHEMQGTMAGTLEAFNRPGFKASAHYAVGKAGRVVQFRPDRDVCYSQGNLRDPDMSIPLIAGWVRSHINPNTACVSIEWEGAHTGGRWGSVLWHGMQIPGFLKPPAPPPVWWEPTEAQYQAGLELIRQLCQVHTIRPDANHILLHSQFDSVGKWWCPGQRFPLRRLLGDLAP